MYANSHGFEVVDIKHIQIALDVGDNPIEVLLSMDLIMSLIVVSDLKVSWHLPSFAFDHGLHGRCGELADQLRHPRLRLGCFMTSEFEMVKDYWMVRDIRGF